MERRESRDRITTSPAEQWAARELSELSRDELEAELTIAAYAPGHMRIGHFERLLAERRRRLIAA